jgi:GNAT superfamily N-acetyltransferase
MRPHGEQTLPPPTLVRCAGDAEFAEAVALTREYIDWLGLDLSFQDIDRELAGFAAMYSPPRGCFLLARVGAAVAGGAGLRLFAEGICEMKRLFLPDRFRGLGLGRVICLRLIEEARALGYECMRLDTLAHMQAARQLYKDLGFTEIEPYRYNPDPEARYLELRLNP